MIVHRGIPRQRGRGGGYVGRWMIPYHHQTGRGFKDMAKAALKVMGPKVLRTAYQVGMDLMSGKRVKDSLMNRGKQLAMDTVHSVPGIVKQARVRKTAGQLQTLQNNMRQAMADRMRRKKRRRVPPPSTSRRIHKSRVKRSRPQLQRGRGRRRSSVKRILRRGLRKLRKNNRIIKRTIDIFD